MMDTAAQVIDEILDMELEMFLTVPGDGHSACQEHPEHFRFHRRMQFSVWSTGTLSCYRKDLRRALRNGENLMTVKYARMQGLIPSRNTNPLIDAILRIQLAGGHDASLSSNHATCATACRGCR